MLKDEIPHDIIDKYGITLMILFGSYGDGTNNKFSDLDIGYLSKELLSRTDELELLEDLVVYYQKGDLDLVDLKKATPALKLEVANKGKLIYGTAEEFLKF